MTIDARHQRQPRRQEELAADPDYQRLRELLQEQSHEQVESFYQRYEHEESLDGGNNATKKQG
jgi:hypothetical protein